jgi:hypothetical protein
MDRWHTPSNPQHTLPGSAACALGTISFVRRGGQSKPGQRRRS